MTKKEIRPTRCYNPAMPEIKRTSWVARHWKRAAIALVFVGILLCRDYIAPRIGYAVVAMETANEHGKTIREFAAPSPGIQFTRDLILLLIAVGGIWVAHRRNVALDRQSKAAADAVKNDSRRHVYERFSNAVELMAKTTVGNKPAISARVGGIYIMQELAEQQPEKFARQAVKNLSAYIKDNARLTSTEPHKDAPRDNKRKSGVAVLGEDVKAAFDVLGKLFKDEVPGISDDDVNFADQNFSNLDMSHVQVNLRYYKNWREVNFQGADLRGASFAPAANLTGANFQGAWLSGATFDRVCLQEANLREVQTDGGTSLVFADLSKADLRGAVLPGTYAVCANFSHAKLQGANLTGANFESDEDCPAQNRACFAGANLEGAKLSNATLCHANMTSTLLWGADFVDANLRGADFSGAQFNATNMSGAKFDFVPTSMKEAMDSHVWFAGDDAWADGICQRGVDAFWDFRERDYYALNGVMRNFSESSTDSRLSPAVSFAMQREALSLTHEEQEPFSPNWNEWLKGVDSRTGKHHYDEDY